MFEFTSDLKCAMCPHFAGGVNLNLKKEGSTWDLASAVTL